jgi:hypothetical protein
VSAHGSPATGSATQHSEPRSSDPLTWPRFVAAEPRLMNASGSGISPSTTGEVQRAPSVSSTDAFHQSHASHPTRTSRKAGRQAILPYWLLRVPVTRVSQNGGTPRKTCYDPGSVLTGTTSHQRYRPPHQPARARSSHRPQRAGGLKCSPAAGSDSRMPQGQGTVAVPLGESTPDLRITSKPLKHPLLLRIHRSDRAVRARPSSLPVQKRIPVVN